ncbi:MAG: class I SAM-dependent methyltransferase [Rhodothermales bacterium]
MRNVNPYTVLASGYDFIMSHVDYPGWAAYVDELIRRFHHLNERPIQLLELGCGTGNFGFEFAHYPDYHYRGLDGSASMIKVAGHKAEQWGEDLEFAVCDFLSFDEDETNDVVLLLYDGLNYLLEPSAIAAVLGRVYRSLRPGGLFLFDQSTPANSENNRDYFEDRGAHELFSYVRQSEYDAETRLHRTHFELSVGPDTFAEDHTQRAYAISEIATLVEASQFEEVDCFEGFSTIGATEASERVQWILRRPM